MDADARSPQPRSHRFSRVRVGRIRDRVKRSVAADHVAILVEPIAIGILLAAFATKRVIDRIRLIKLAGCLTLMKPTLKGSEIGWIVDMCLISSTSVLLFILKIAFDPLAVGI
jgi:hypothetical protein